MYHRNSFLGSFLRIQETGLVRGSNKSYVRDECEEVGFFFRYTPYLSRTQFVQSYKLCPWISSSQEHGRDPSLSLGYVSASRLLRIRNERTCVIVVLIF
jgi:hypothetical protein